MTEFGSQTGHERYEALCALSSAGVLTAAESESLAAHLQTCAACREAFFEYQSIATEGMSFLADSFVTASSADAFDEASALSRLLDATGQPRPQTTPIAIKAAKGRAWKRAWVGGLIAASLVVAFGLGAHSTSPHSAGMPGSGASAESRAALDRLTTEKQALERTIQAANQRIAGLEQQAVTDKDDLTKVSADAETAGKRLAEMTHAMNAARGESDARLAALIEERDESTNRLHDAERKYQTAEEELNTLRSRREQVLVQLDEVNALRDQHNKDLLQVSSLATRVDRLTAELNEQGKRARTDEQYLVSDKDIRDLIGARNLYIADIMDVNSAGQSQKPFGRVFYTKTKSLVFYAYDLDRQPGVRRTSTFQVWGRTSANDRKPINLGILYLDSETNRRWTLHVDKPEQLARLDAIFVTVEPREQPDKPTGKPFLYASLRRDPNHP